MAEAQTPLSGFLRDARERRNLSLRSVEEATGVSNAYLSQLEHGRIRQPSPLILHKLSELYGASYAEVMRLAGYPMPSHTEREGAPHALARLGDVTPEEERALAEYLEFLRARRRRGPAR
ncbi:MAG: helix-turn-helix domain-containing protein [Bryobacteraceae bacterium]